MNCVKNKQVLIFPVLLNNSLADTGCGSGKTNNFQL